jgi:2-dehydro-3-deoxyphosphooctonate aldolase (KDO 8-P synthase)
MLYNNLKKKPFFILGPCVIESEELIETVADKILELKRKFDAEFIFKASFDKANRTSFSSFRGPGIEKGLEMLGGIKEKYSLPVTTDVHEPWQAKLVGEVVDIIQIPAFLCRQTDLLVAAANTNKIVNIKKAQFLSGVDMQYPAQKVIESGNSQVILTERGNMFGYNNLVVDFRNIDDMKNLGYPVCMDCTHSVQRPGGSDGKTGGDRKFVPYMAKSAKAFGCNGYFLEVHPDPDNGKSDAANMMYLNQVENLVAELISPL